MLNHVFVLTRLFQPFVCDMNANLEKKCPIRFRNTLFTRMVFKQLEILDFMLAGNGSGILQKGGVLSEIVIKKRAIIK